MFRKARILAIFDDLDTILLMVPLTILLVGFRWQLEVMPWFGPTGLTYEGHIPVDPNARCEP
jgi:hypothetical protein